MAANNQVDILLRTIGDASGADKINAALGIVQKSEKDLAAMRSQFLTAAEAERSKVEALVAASQKLQQARAAEAKEAEAARVRAPLLAAGIQREREELEKLAAAKKQAASEVYRSQQVAANPWASASQGKSVIEQHVEWRKQIYSVNQQLANQGQAQDKVAGSSRNMGNALLQASRGIQDMQYGLAGAVNNLEGIASALGMSAGVAGVITVLAVAVQQLGPHVITWLKSLDSEGAKLTELKATLERAGAAIKGDYSSNVANASRISEAFTLHLKQERDALEANDRALDSNVRLLKQRADLQKSENQRRLESDIEDIKAQNLPKDQERAAIATRKREELDANKKLADDAASAGISTDADKLTSQAKYSEELQAKKAALEKEQAAALEYQTLLNEQKKLLDKVAAAEAALNSVATMEDPEAYAKAREKANMARADLNASQAQSDQIKSKAPEGRIRSADEIQKELDQVKPQAQAADDQTLKDADALNAKIKEEQLAREFRDKEYKRNLDKIAREQNGGVYDQGNLNAPPAGLPGSPAPLGPPAAPGTTLPAPSPGFGPAELNPSRVPSNAPAPAYGPQPNAPDAAAVSDKGGEKMAAAMQKVEAVFTRMAALVEQSGAAMEKKVALLEQKERSRGILA